MFILKKGHQPGVYVPLRALFLVFFKILSRQVCGSCQWNGCGVYFKTIKGKQSQTLCLKPNKIILCLIISFSGLSACESL